VTGTPGVDPALGTTPVGHMTSDEERSLGEIVGDLGRDMTTLVKQELELARAELKQEAAKAGRGVGMLGGAGVAALLMLLLASSALAFLLDNWMPVELAFLITALVWAVVAAVLALRGRAELRRVTPQLPETQQTLKEDASWVKAQKS
jgi:uncharacterized membrane protein YqjE